jgi:hypothetical protein
MALLHQADLRPTKLELLNAWLPSRPWYRGPAVPDLKRVAGFRFDDPDGEVGIETLLVQAGGGPVVQAPLTYRGAPLDGGEPWLVGTIDHSVLGKRWVYDACGDRVYAHALASAIFTGSGEAEEFVDVDGRLERRAPSMSVRGSGAGGAAVPAVTAVVRVDDDDPTVIVTDSVELAVPRILGDVSIDGQLTLTGSWSGQPTPLVLAHAR